MTRVNQTLLTVLLAAFVGLAMMFIFNMTLAPANAEATPVASGQCCSDCSDVKKFIEAVCSEASYIPPVRDACKKYSE